MKIKWDTEPLGTMTDQDLANILGVHPSTVTYARNRRNIPSFRDGPYKKLKWFHSLPKKLLASLRLIYPWMTSDSRGTFIHSRCPTTNLETEVFTCDMGESLWISNEQWVKLSEDWTLNRVRW